MSKIHLYNTEVMVDTNNSQRDVEEEVVEEDTFIEHEDFELEDEELSMQDKLKIVREKLKACEAEKQTYLDDLQRARADFLNSRRRLEEQLARDKERATDKILTELLTIADSFDSAMADRTLWDTLPATWKTGVEAIHAKLISMLRSNQVTSINPLGAPFNPEEHEAVSNSPVTDATQVDMVVSVLQKGYKRNADILRPARVVVGVDH